MKPRNFSLQTCGAVKSAPTGQQYIFIVETCKVDGSDFRKVDVKIVALNTAQAWRIIGEAVQRFMDGPRGRMVNSIFITK